MIALLQHCCRGVILQQCCRTLAPMTINSGSWREKNLYMNDYNLVLEAKTNKSDILGVLASGLCLIHCLVTPILFASHAGISGHGHENPGWWSIIDSILLVISFLAVLWSVRKTSRNWMKILLFASWGVLCLVILNEKMEWFHLMEEAIYIPSLSLIGLHIFNRRYCQCADDQCCADPLPPQ